MVILELLFENEIIQKGADEHTTSPASGYNSEIDAGSLCKIDIKQKAQVLNSCH